MDPAFFTLFFAKALMILAVAYGIGFVVRLKIPDVNLPVLRRCMSGAVVLYTVLILIMGNDPGALGGILGVINFLTGGLAAWALLMGVEKRIIELWEFFLPSFYRKVQIPVTQKSSSQQKFKEF